MGATEIASPLVLLCSYIVMGLLAMCSGLVELIKHKASWNSIKILFYSLFILQCLCRCLIITWGMIEVLEGGEFYSNFPSLLFISYGGLLALQMVQFLPGDDYYLLSNSKKDISNSNKLRIGTNILIGYNLVMYFGMFLMFGVAQKLVGNASSFSIPNATTTTTTTTGASLLYSTSTTGSTITIDQAINYLEYDTITGTTTTTGTLLGEGNGGKIAPIERNGQAAIYTVIDYFYFFCLLLLISAHCYVGWKTYLRFKDLFGIKLNIIHLGLIICMVIRAIMIVVNPSPNSSIIHIDKDSVVAKVYMVLYYAIGEIFPGLIILSIQFLLPFHTEKNYSQLGGELTNPQDIWAAENISIHELLGIGGSGAKVHRCTVKKGPLRGGTYAVKVMKDCTPEDQESLMNEIKLHERLKSPYIVSYHGHTIVKNSEIRLFMEYIPHTLDKYLKARKVCGDKHGNGSNQMLKNYLLHMQEYHTSVPNISTGPQTFPYYFTYAQIVWNLYQIAIGLDTLHNHRIAHRDLKTNNIFVTLSDFEIKHCKIGDFDISKSFKKVDSIDTQSIQTAFQNDIYSFGILTYDFLSLNNASCLMNMNVSHPAFSNPVLPDYVLQLSPDLETPTMWEPIVNLYKSCTAENPSMRPSSIEVKYILSDLHKKVIESGGTDHWISR
ncbi:hypothetical protein CYY_001041 [Polysphondylium violaceum]|uniref:Protein kinase domain-containing protein n=1 Tax=Polysphondylium violaceum TaxID=133409 RepID=A0A8J4VAY9_9MYCE|nr:hypothetical protein CYY_001041 [Polysphondylium violaceum]